MPRKKQKIPVRQISVRIKFSHFDERGWIVLHYDALFKNCKESDFGLHDFVNNIGPSCCTLFNDIPTRENGIYLKDVEIKITKKID